MEKRILIAIAAVLYGLGAIGLIWGYVLSGEKAIKIAGIVLLAAGAAVHTYYNFKYKTRR